MGWWLYVGAALVLAAAAVAWVMLRGYNRVRPKPLPGIACPEMSHGILGHPEKMLHPLKHELRLDLCDTIKDAVHQLLFMTHASVFINDASEAFRVLRQVPTKGDLYHLFRLEGRPDLMSTDGEAHATRAAALVPSLLHSSDEEVIAQTVRALMEYLAAHRQQVVDTDRVFALFSFDLVVKVLFRFDLGALQGSAQGARLLECLRTTQDAKAAGGLYPNPVARKVTPEEAQAAESDWRAFLDQLADHVTLKAPTAAAHSVIAQLAALSASCAEGRNSMVSEIHQLLKHGAESVAGSMLWAAYTLAKHRRVREKLEVAVWAHEQAGLGGQPEYLQAFLKEVLRRYPVAGNFTVRTLQDEAYALLGGASVPQGSTLHVHMFSLHNTTREWTRPMEILPERWLESAQAEAEDIPLGPRCPFASERSTATAFDGLGFRENSLSFFPFSVGPRACPGRNLSVDVLHAFLRALITRFHLNFADALGWDNDPGISLESTIVPLNPKILKMRVLKVMDMEKLVKQEAGGLEEQEARDEAAAGWAAPEKELSRNVE